MAQALPSFTSEDVWEALTAIDPTIDPKKGSFLGAALRRVAKSGDITLDPHRVEPSKRPANHSRILRVWRSNLWAGTA